jgi:hypothetical protein
VKWFALGNSAGLLFAGIVAAIAVTTPSTNKWDRLAEDTRAGDVRAAFIEYMAAPVRLARWW